MQYSHIPVLLHEVIELLDPQTGENCVDGTLGGGGYSREMLKRTAPSGRLLSIDLDADALKNFGSSEKRATLVNGNFKDIDKIIVKHDFKDIHCIVADLGFSSYQLDTSGRGLSFMQDEPLDMRFDLSQKEDARFLLEAKSEQELKDIFTEYGEEKFSRQIARAITMEKKDGRHITRTRQLYDCIQQALPKPVRHRADDSARRIFQALRIAVNHELENLETFLPAAFNILAPGGRLAIVTFHSLEDRMVKKFFQDLRRGCVCPPDFPICQCGRLPEARLLNKKPITASEEELKHNPRSRPAKLRAIKKA